VLAGCSNNNVLISTDYGQSWSFNHRLEVQTASVRSIIKTTAGAILAVTFISGTYTYKIWETADNGSNWSLKASVEDYGTSLPWLLET
jgi:photosystem II stability/assembly factor-like uncharacterized protein